MTSTEPKLSPRATVLWTIAENYTDLVDPLNSRAGIHGTGESLGGIGKHDPRCFLTTTEGDQGVSGVRCTCSVRTVREFERLMTTMRNDRHRALIAVYDAKGNLIEKASVRKLHWHLLEYHLKAVRTTRAPKLTIAKGHTRKLVKLQVDDHGSPLPIFRVHRHPQARMELAAAATEWQADNWGLSHEPMLPAAMTEPMMIAA